MMPKFPELRIAWLRKFEDEHALSERDRKLLHRATRVFENNLCLTGNEAWGNLPGVLPSPGKYNGMWNWDSAFHALALADIDPDLAYDQFEIFFRVQGNDGILPDVIFDSGAIMDNYSKPPVFAWAFAEVYRRAPRPERLERAYSCLCKNLEFWNTKRRDTSGLYHYDCRRIDGNWLDHQKWESGMDTSPRWDNGVEQWLAPDLCSFMVTFYDALEQLAQWLAKPQDAVVWHNESQLLKDRINRELWCEEKHCFADRNRFNGQFSDVLSSVDFVPLFAGCADTEHAAWMDQNARDPRRFFPSMPTVAFECDSFRADDYWRGPVWLNFAYFAAAGLKKYGYSATADALCETVLQTAANETRSIFEYYNPLTGEGLGASSFGWSAAFIMEFIRSKY